ncbi:MAG TPA: PAS domain-containing protein, partial [Anaerovoracaceae bacterium]|nr:PAS domain-containing protein [Anaerovoracaceae bacterium]
MPETRITNELTYSTQFIESIINLSPDIIYIYDLIEHKNIYSNDGVQRVLGYSAREIQGMGCNLLALLMHPDDFEIYLTDTFPQYARLKEKQPIIHEYRMKHKNGTWRWLDCNEIIYLRQQDGTPIQIFGVVHDITQQKELQDKLLIVNKAVESISVAIGIS